MKDTPKYDNLELKALLDLLDKRYSQLALMYNNKFNLEIKCNELNKDITELRKEIARKSSQEKSKAEAPKEVKPKNFEESKPKAVTKPKGNENTKTKGTKK